MKDLRISTRSFTNNSEGHIEKEIEELRTQFSKTQGSNDTAWNNSVLRVLFKNEFFARKYRVKIENFLKELLDEGEEFIVYHPPNPNSEQEFEDNHQTFHIDKVNYGNPDNSEILQEVPVYASHYEETLQCDEEDITEDTKEEKRSMFTCFNCLGSHHLKECPEKIDWPRINANKKEILSGNNTRYHTDDQNNGLRAGIISENLRNALGLKRNQLPQFIYHMRVIGYPPGWMNEAVFETSGLSLYNSEGKVSDEDELPSAVEGTLYDGTKFIDFPGFNSAVPDGFLDEWKALKMPPLQPHQQLKEALKSPNIIFSSNNFNKRKQNLNNEDVDSKKLKNVAEKPSTPLPKGKVTKNGCTTPERHAKNFDFITPDSKQTNKRLSMSLSMSPGTPILKQGNPYSKLPDADKFAEGITEHLPFENLPDAVGTFEKMRGVISGVQRKLNDIKKS